MSGSESPIILPVAMRRGGGPSAGWGSGLGAKCPSPTAARRSPSPSHGDREDSGFTLIEMMVALAIFSLVALTLLKLEGTIVRSSGEIASQALGQIVAHNMAVETLTDPRPAALGTAEGVTDNGGRRWSWTRTATITADPRLVRVDIAVRDEAGRPAGALTLARPAQ